MTIITIEESPRCRRETYRVYGFIYFSSECTSRSEYNFLLLQVFITPSKSTMHKLQRTFRVSSIEGSKWKISNRIFPKPSRSSFDAAYSSPSKISCTLSCWCVYSVKIFSSVLIPSQRGNEEMDKVFVRKWKINQCNVWRCWFGFRNYSFRNLIKTFRCLGQFQVLLNETIEKVYCFNLKSMIEL